MIVAARAVDRQAGKRRHRGHQHVVAIVRAGDRLIDGPFAQLHVPHEIPRAGGYKAGRNRRLRVVGKQHVAGKLLQDKTRVRLVGVERRIT